MKTYSLRDSGLNVSVEADTKAGALSKVARHLVDYLIPESELSEYNTDAITVIDGKNYDLGWVTIKEEPCYIIINGVDVREEDIVNPEDIDTCWSFWVLYDQFTTVAVWAESLQDALDMAVDDNRLESLSIKEADYDDYKINTDNATCSFLGNACEPYDISDLCYVEVTLNSRRNIGELRDNFTIRSSR